MVSMILLAGLGLGAVVMEGSRRAVETDRSVSAYYMADAGIERQLYEVRKRGKPVAQLQGLVETYPNGSTWSFFGDYEQVASKKIALVPPLESEVVDLFNPDDLAVPGFDEAFLTWSDGDDCVGKLPKVEVGSVKWDLANAQFSDQYQIDFAAPGAVQASIPLDPSRAYRLRVRTFDCSIKNLTVQARTGGVAKPFPGDIQIAAEGTVGAATQKIFVGMPRLDVLSDLFSFVVFSECSLVKGTGETPVCPP